MVRCGMERLLTELYIRSMSSASDMVNQLETGGPYRDPETREPVSLRRLLGLLVNEVYWMYEMGKEVYEKLHLETESLEFPSDVLQKAVDLLEKNKGNMDFQSYLLFEEVKNVERF